MELLYSYCCSYIVMSIIIIIIWCYGVFTIFGLSLQVIYYIYIYVSNNYMPLSTHTLCCKQNYYYYFITSTSNMMGDIIIILLYRIVNIKKLARTIALWVLWANSVDLNNSVKNVLKIVRTTVLVHTIIDLVYVYILYYTKICYDLTILHVCRYSYILKILRFFLFIWRI